MLALPVCRGTSCGAGAHARAGPFSVRESTQVTLSKPRLLDRVRAAARVRHYSRRTEDAYVAWIKRYVFFFHAKRHPAGMGAPEVTRFLSSLAVDGQVAASTQNQALSALLFLYRDVLEIDLPWLDGIVRARRPERLPVVLTREEVRGVLQRLGGTPRLMPHSMVCECKAGVLEVSQDSMTTTINTGGMWTCHKGMVETVENKGTAPAIMRVIELMPA